MQSSRHVWHSSLFFISPNLIAIFQSRMTWWKRLNRISIVWISTYMLLAKHSPSFICDLSVSVCPVLDLVHAKGNIMPDDQGLFISSAILPPAFTSLCPPLSWKFGTEAISNMNASFCWVAKHLGRGQSAPRAPIVDVTMQKIYLYVRSLCSFSFATR